MIAPTFISNFDEIVKKMILKAEGHAEQPKNIGDHTVTYGYGYTFIRKSNIKGKDVWSIYGYLEGDLFEIGIMLNWQEQDSCGREL